MERPAPGETVVARVSLGCIAIRCLDGAFVHPAAGTTAGDHLASGLIVPAALAAVAVAYPRLRAWWQAALALATGALTLLVAVAVPARHALASGPDVADVLGILAGLAGAALVACGVRAAVRAWQAGTARRPPRARWIRRGLETVAVTLGLLFVVVPAGVALLATHRARTTAPPADLGRPYVPVTFRTTDGLRLHGWYVPSRNRAAVVVTPGRTGPVRQARMLARNGYGVLLFDRRGEGASDGDFNAYGWHGDRDVEAAAAFLAARPDVEPSRIGGLGLSTGGEQLLQAAAHDRRLRAVVAEGAGVRSIRDHVAGHPGNPLAWVSPLLVQTAATAVLSDSTPPPALTDAVARIAPRAVFLIAAGHGQGGEELNPAYLAAAGRPARLWTIPEAHHTGGLTTRPAEYERRVLAFFARYLAGD